MKTQHLTKGFIAIVTALFVMNSLALGQWTLSGNKVYTTNTAYHVGVGTGSTMSFYKKLEVKYTYNTSYPTYGIYVDIKNTDDDAEDVYGTYVLASSYQDGGDGDVYGTYTKATSTEETSKVFGGYFEAAGTDDNDYSYGLYVNAGTTGPYSRHWGIYVDNGKKNYFEKSVGIGVEHPGKTLDVNGTTRTKVVEITGGSDLAEPFEVTDTESVKPGMVVSIDPEQPGQLCVSSQAYDRTVAGIISGAGGINPGIVLSSSASEQKTAGQHPVALTGRVYAWADASNGPIEPGDLLTTSEMPGHAMKVTDYEQAQGTIIGKSMSSLEEGQGLVLVLVALQ